jgi:hypothetical protein
MPRVSNCSSARFRTGKEILIHDLADRTPDGDVIGSSGERLALLRGAELVAPAGAPSAGEWAVSCVSRRSRRRGGPTADERRLFMAPPIVVLCSAESPAVCACVGEHCAVQSRPCPSCAPTKTLQRSANPPQVASRRSEEVQLKWGEVDSSGARRRPSTDWGSRGPGFKSRQPD